MREWLSLWPKTEACRRIAVASIGTRLVSISTRLVSFAPCCGLQMRERLSLTEACLAVASIGPLLVSIGTRLFRLLRASVRRCGNGFLFSQRPRPVSLWNELPLTLIARRWPCAFFLSDSNRMLNVKDTVLRRELLQSHWRRGKRKTLFVECCQRSGQVKDTVLRRELASISLATRNTKNFLRGMLSAFRAGVHVSVVVGLTVTITCLHCKYSL